MNPIKTFLAPRRRPLTLASTVAAAILTRPLLAGCAGPPASTTPTPVSTSASTPMVAIPTPEPTTEPAVVEPDTGAVVTLEITDTSFSPRQLTLNVGDTLTVTNTGQLEHSWTSDDGAIDSGFLAPA